MLCELMLFELFAFQILDKEYLVALFKLHTLYMIKNF